MNLLRPRAHLETHEVTNQPPPLENLNLFESDHALMDALARAGAAEHRDLLSEFSARAGAPETARWAREADEFPPRLKIFDRYGRRIDEVEFHPAYHELMKLRMRRSKIASAALAIRLPSC